MKKEEEKKDPRRRRKKEWKWSLEDNNFFYLKKEENDNEGKNNLFPFSSLAQIQAVRSTRRGRSRKESPKTLLPPKKNKRKEHEKGQNINKRRRSTTRRLYRKETTFLKTWDIKTWDRRDKRKETTFLSFHFTFHDIKSFCTKLLWQESCSCIVIRLQFALLLSCKTWYKVLYPPSMKKKTEPFVTSFP